MTPPIRWTTATPADYERKIVIINGMKLQCRVLPEVGVKETIYPWRDVEINSK